MTEARKAGPTIGCLMIEDIVSGGHRLSGLCNWLNRQGIYVCRFEWNGTGDLHREIQEAYHAVRKECGTACIVAIDRGADAAIALGAQLPVEKTAIILTAQANCMRKHDHRQVARLRRFVRRNAAFCVSDMLIAAQNRNIIENRARQVLNCTANCLHRQMVVYGNTNKNICTNGEWMLKEAIFSFLCGRELPKNLAENSEMCIIYE